MTTVEALAAAYCKATHDRPQACDYGRYEAGKILAALPRGWRLTDEQPASDAYRRGWAEGAAETADRLRGTR